jgi:hypothetical protein
MSQSALNVAGEPLEQDLLQVVYVSSATAPWSEEDLLRALETFQARNVRRGITGLLLYCDGNFMQAIEGPRAEIIDLERRIAADPRHRGFLALSKRGISTREFSGWSMGFRSLTDRDRSSNPGWSDFLGGGREGLKAPDAPGRALRLLLSFRESMLR